MGRATEYLAVINMKRLPAVDEVLCMCGSLGESDLIEIKSARKRMRKLRNLSAKNKAMVNSKEEVMV
jgi:CBS-domain-containing membrane protein